MDDVQHSIHFTCSQSCLKKRWWVLGQSLLISFGSKGSDVPLLWLTFYRFFPPSNIYEFIILFFYKQQEQFLGVNLAGCSLNCTCLFILLHKSHRFLLILLVPSMRTGCVNAMVSKFPLILLKRLLHPLHLCRKHHLQLHFGWWNWMP